MGDKINPRPPASWIVTGESTHPQKTGEFRIEHFLSIASMAARFASQAASCLSGRDPPAIPLR